MSLKMTSLHFQLRNIEIPGVLLFKSKKIQYIFDGLSDFLLMRVLRHVSLISTVLLTFQLMILELGNIAK